MDEIQFVRRPVFPCRYLSSFRDGSSSKERSSLLFMFIHLFCSPSRYLFSSRSIPFSLIVPPPRKIVFCPFQVDTSTVTRFRCPDPGVRDSTRDHYTNFLFFRRYRPSSSYSYPLFLHLPVSSLMGRRGPGRTGVPRVPRTGIGIGVTGVGNGRYKRSPEVVLSNLK